MAYTEEFPCDVELDGLHLIVAYALLFHLVPVQISCKRLRDCKLSVMKGRATRVYSLVIFRLVGVAQLVWDRPCNNS